MIIGIIIDMQEDFVNGPLGTPEAKAIVPYVQKQTHDKAFDMLFFTQDWHTRSTERYNLEMNRIPYHCMAGSNGARIVKGLIDENIPTFRTLQKNNFGLYSLPDILMDEACGYGDDITEIHIMGVCTDICVISNALILRSAFPSVPIYVRANGCAGTTPEAHKAALTVMQNCLIDVLEEI